MNLPAQKTEKQATGLKYRDIFQQIKEKIDSQQWLENQVIPTERELAELYQTSRTTIRKAVEYLKQRGYLHSEHGRGTFVLPAKSRESHSLHSFSDDILARGGKPEQTVLEIGLVPLNEVMRTNLALPLSTRQVFHLKRLRFSNTTPMGIQTSYLPLPANAQISEAELLAAGSLYALLSEKYQMVPLEAYESIGARQPSPSEARLLELGQGDVVLTSSRITLSRERKPMEYVEMVYPANRYSYKIKVTKDSFSQ